MRTRAEANSTIPCSSAQCCTFLPALLSPLLPLLSSFHRLFFPPLLSPRFFPLPPFPPELQLHLLCSALTRPLRTSSVISIRWRSTHSSSATAVWRARASSRAETIKPAHHPNHSLPLPSYLTFLSEWSLLFSLTNSQLLSAVDVRCLPTAGTRVPSPRQSAAARRTRHQLVQLIHLHSLMEQYIQRCQSSCS